MPKKIDSKCSKCRRAGTKLFLKGEKCLGPKCALVKRNFPPGQHGAGAKRSKLSGYGKQLREKQQAKQMYGLRERQFANYVNAAAKKTGDTSRILIELLESRLDNIVYRMGIAPSRVLARQMVSHGHFTVNGKKLDIPSYSVKVSDVIAITDKSKSKRLFENIADKLAKYEAPSWLHVDVAKLSAKVLNKPTAENLPFNSKVIIEFYSR